MAKKGGEHKGNISGDNSAGVPARKWCDSGSGNGTGDGTGDGDGQGQGNGRVTAQVKVTVMAQ